jgi:hypothetical protein
VALPILVGFLCQQAFVTAALEGSLRHRRVGNNMLVQYTVPTGKR